MTLYVYGMSGCTTVKRAQNWLETNNVPHEYAHYNKLDNLPTVLNMMIDASSLTEILNTNSQAFKKLNVRTQQELLGDRAVAIQAMTENPRLIKRPIAFDGLHVLSGFKQAQWQDLIV